MKIIKRVEPKFESKQITCLNCTSMLEYDLRDVEIEAMSKYGGCYSYLTCPVCSGSIMVTFKDVS